MMHFHVLSCIAEEEGKEVSCLGHSLAWGGNPLRGVNKALWEQGSHNRIVWESLLSADCITVYTVCSGSLGLT